MAVSIDKIIAGLNTISELAQIKADKRIADETDAKRCGNCTRWMKSRECPREKSSMRGYSQGPSADASACTEFLLKAGVAELKAARLAAVGKRLAAVEARVLDRRA